MSGGHFDYQQYHLQYIAEKIQKIIDRNGKPIEPKDRFSYYDIDEDATYEEYSEETIKEFQNAVKYLLIAKEYAQRVDWLLSGDDGEDSFHERLKEDLNELEKNNFKP
jgi:hypothetical protein